MSIVSYTATKEEAERRGVNVHQISTGEWVYETHVGRCLSEREKNRYDDSDFYMIVWDDEKQAPDSICFASTRYWSGPCFGSCVDATPEIRAKYDTFCAQRAEERAEQLKEYEDSIPQKTLDVEVITGRKHAGKSGRVFWIGFDRYPSDTGKCCGVETSEGEEFFVSMDHCKVSGAKYSAKEAVRHMNFLRKIGAY